LKIGLYRFHEPVDERSIASLEKSLRVTVSLVSVYRAWRAGRIEDDLDWLRPLASCPRQVLLTWEPWDPLGNRDNPADQPEYRLSRVIEGRFDDYIRKFTRELRRFRSPVWLRPMHEMNGNWYPWCATTNGNTPGDYLLAWRHLCSVADGSNVRWVWSPYVTSHPPVPGNGLTALYPGDECVDVVGLDGYNWGTSRSWSRWESLGNLFGPARREIRAVSGRSLWITETACAESGGDKAAWIRDAAETLAQWGDVETLVWFDDKKECDWRISSTRRSRVAFAALGCAAFPEPEASPRVSVRHGEGEALGALLLKHGQEHLIEWTGQLSGAERKRFFRDLKPESIETVLRLQREFNAAGGLVRRAAPGSMAQFVSLPKDAEEQRKRDESRRVGESMISRGEVAVLISAGGNGSRLGTTIPKGCFPISPVRAKSLFQLLAESVLAISIRYHRPVPLLLMTNPDTEAEIVAFLAEHRFFGIDPRDVHIFPQRVLPTISPEGKLLVGQDGRLLVNPDGHGGMLHAMQDAGLVEQLLGRGVRELFCCQVDNPLVHVADPVFCGLHRRVGAEVSTKVLRRSDCEEKVGVFVEREGRVMVVEYSDMDPGARCDLDGTGQLRDWAGNTGIHLLSLPFIERMVGGSNLPFHRSVKNVTALDDHGQARPQQAWKFERFIFDVIPQARVAFCQEVLREEEFAPLKNAVGPDSPAMVREALVRRHRRWLEGAGVRLAPGVPVEISPLYCLDEDGLAACLRDLPLEINAPAYIPDDLPVHR